jgi:hypothetical protein
MKFHVEPPLESFHVPLGWPCFLVLPPTHEFLFKDQVVEILKYAFLFVVISLVRQ